MNKVKKIDFENCGVLYVPEKKNSFFGWAMIWLFMVFCFGLTATSNTKLCLISLLFLGAIIFKEYSFRIKNICFCTDFIRLQYSKFGLDRALDLPYNQLSYTMKNEFIARGVVQDVLRFYVNGKIVIKLSTNYNGFDDLQLKNICNLLDEKNVKTASQK